MAPKPLQFTPEADRLIKQAYTEGYGDKNRGMCAVAQKLGISTASINRRANQLGLAKVSHKPQTVWTPKEEELLEANAHKDLETINRLLVKHGSPSRGLEAIRSKLRRMGLGLRDAKADAGIYTAGQFAELMGMHHSGVTKLIQNGRLKAQKRQGIDQVEYLIKAKDIRDYIGQYLPRIDLGKPDKYWLYDILTGAL